MNRARAIVTFAALLLAAAPALGADNLPAWLYATPGSHAVLTTDALLAKLPGGTSPNALKCPPQGMNR